MPNTESQIIEFKQELSESFESEVIAFLNSKTGGHIFIGIADDGTVLGVKDADLVQRQIADRILNNIARKISGKQSNNNKIFPVNDPVKQVLETIRITPNLSYNQIALKIGKSPATVKRALSRLKELNRIKRVGSDKTGYWEIIQ